MNQAHLLILIMERILTAAALKRFTGELKETQGKEYSVDVTVKTFEHKPV
jgi:hypothetical protein